MKLLLASIAVIGLAHAAPNFSGEWKMNIAKSDFGPIKPVPEVLTRSIKHADPAIEYTTHQKGQQGDVTTQIKYTTDGKTCVNTVNGSEAKGTAKWQGNNLVIESTREIQGLQLSSKETWSLSDDGKTLTIASHITIPQQGEFDLRLVLEKQ